MKTSIVAAAVLAGLSAVADFRPPRQPIRVLVELGGVFMPAYADETLVEKWCR